MRSLALVVLLCMALFLPAQASSFEDFNHGVWAHSRGDNDAVIAFMTKALVGGDLTPKLQAVAYVDRGVAYDYKEQTDAAIADLTAAIKLDPSNSAGYIVRQSLYYKRGDLAGAIADLGSAMALMPVDAWLPSVRGRFEWQLGQFDASAADFARSLAIDHSDAYRVLWLELARLHTGAADPAEFQRNADALDLDGWPEPIIRFYLGRVTAAEAQSLAASGDAKTQKKQICEANFYIGEWDLLYRKLTEAKPLLAAAAADCPKNFMEASGAVSELARMNGDTK